MASVAAKMEEGMAAHVVETITGAERAAVELEMDGSYWSTWSELLTRGRAQMARHNGLVDRVKGALAPGTEKLTGPLSEALDAVEEYGFTSESDVALATR